MKKLLRVFLALFVLLSLSIIFTACSNNACTEHKEKWVIDIPATCTEPGVKHAECEYCKYHMGIEFIDATGHNFVDYSCTACSFSQGTEGLTYIKNTEGTGYIVTGYGSAEESGLIIPSKYKNLPVMSINENAFKDNTLITSITIPNSVTTIGYSAFSGCSKLTSVTIGNSVKTIGNSVFKNCTVLTSVTIGNSVKTIGDEAFSGCDSLTSVTIPNSVTSIGSYAFDGCHNLTSVYITDITAWCNITFSGSYSNPLCFAHNLYLNNELITELTIPDGVTTIGHSAFSGCDSLTSITIPDSVTSIGNYAFNNCTNLTSITIPNSVTSIGNSAFAWCSSLTSITIPNSVTSIGSYVFNGCNGLTSIIIPDSVTSIGWYAFSSCNSLTNIVIPDSVTTIGNYAFEGCNKLTIYCELESKPNGWHSDWNYRYYAGYCPVYWYSENEPTEEGNYWHYDENGEIEIWE